MRAIFLLAGLLVGLNAQQEDIDYLKSDLFNPLNDVNRTRYRLPQTAYPLLYRVEIIPDDVSTANGTFRGIVDITLQVQAQVGEIILNTEAMTIDSSGLYDISDINDNDLLIAEGCVQDLLYGLLVCSSRAPLDPAKMYRLSINYTATLGKDNRGLYVSTYTENGVTKTLLSTHFGQQARRLVPCFDEPEFKANFQLLIHRKTSENTLSNARLERTFPSTISGWEIDQYFPTSKIAPYILAVVISSFNGSVDAPGGNHKLGVYSRPEASQQGAFAYEIGSELIEAFNEWTNLSYYDFELVNKMEMAAIPDFAAGAMENWGLMIFREGNLLYDENHSTSLQKQRIALVISHEIAHMWFGNLVTCDWWDVTWLNEGFARYFQFIALEMKDTSFQGLLQFPVTTMQATMLTDATNSTHPVTNRGNIFSYSDIRTMFSTISYDKGGSILRMVHNMMGNEKFQTAIREYLKNNAYGTANPENLFTEFEKQFPDQHLIEVLSTFTLQEGVPLITATREGNRVKLTQSRFWVDGTEDTSSKWSVPITFATNEGGFANTLNNFKLFRRTDAELSFDLEDGNDYFVLNVQQFNYFRVNYDQESWQAINRALKRPNFGGIHPINRAQIIDDLFQLARAGHLTYDFIFEIVDFVRQDMHYLPWLATLNGLSYVQQRIATEEDRQEFNWYISWLLEPIYKHLDFKTDGDHLDKLNRANILNWACKFNVGDCVDKANAEFNKLKEPEAPQPEVDSIFPRFKGISPAAEETVNPDFTPAVYCSVNRKNEDNFDALWKIYMESNFATEQSNILTALGCTKNQTNIDKLLNLILTNDIRLHDKSATYAAAYQGNPENIDLVLDYIIRNTEEWGKVMSVTSTLGDLSRRFTRMDQFEKTLDFILNSSLTGDQKVDLSIALLQNRRNLEWDRNRLPELINHIGKVKGDQARPNVPNDNGNDGLAWWAWTLIVIGVIAGVGVLGGGGYFAYKKYV